MKLTQPKQLLIINVLKLCFINLYKQMKKSLGFSRFGTYRNTMKFSLLCMLNHSLTKKRKIMLLLHRDRFVRVTKHNCLTLVSNDWE